MNDRDLLIKEISVLPDFIIKQLLNIIHYIKIGIENEYAPINDNDYYNSQEFKRIASESIAEYKSGLTEDMDIIE